MTLRLKDALAIDLEAKAAELSRALREAVLHRLRKRGLVVAVSGGVDSACVAALGARALGPERVFALLLPERESSPESLAYGRALCEKLRISYEVKDITSILDAAGCYQARNAAVREVVPEFEPHMRWKIVLASDPLSSETLHFFRLVVRLGEGDERQYRLPPQAYLRILAATNFKQRTRKMLEYYHADRRNFAVAGTPNRLEYDQGFFVKLGDGAADVKPIADLYKTQVYALARHLGVIEEILGREPTTDTYTLEQSQEDFYYSLHYSKLDLVLWAKNHGLSAESVAAELGYSPEQVRRVYDDIDQKRRATAYLHARPLLLGRIDEIQDIAPGTVTLAGEPG
jgi:NAD+ synthase